VSLQRLCDAAVYHRPAPWRTKILDRKPGSSERILAYLPEITRKR